IGVRERLDADGEIVLALDDAEIARVVAAVREREPQAIAVCFLHAYANDAHERRIADALANAFPNVPIARSSDVDPEYREYERFSTTVVDAALLPIVRRYLDGLRAALAQRSITAPLFVMRSNGGMTDGQTAAARPAALLESGPAGGAIAAAALARRLGANDVLSFDMGGTTAKAATIVGGRVQFATEFEAAGTTHSGRSVVGSGYPVRFPFVDLAEISAGGGTIAWIDDAGSLRVGPLSAGADPGPACYGRSERATVTDANVVLGRLPQTHLLGGTFPIDARRSRAAVAALSERLSLTLEATATGILTLIDAQMAKVLRIVTVERGLDPRDFTLIAFGGNGPLHACSLADDLAIARIVVPARPGVFSAEGLLEADLRATAVRAILRDCDQLERATFDDVFASLERGLRDELRGQGADDAGIVVLREIDARYRGQSFELTIDGSGYDTLEQTFHSAHERRYGYAAPDEHVQIVNARVTASASLGARRPAADVAGAGDDRPRATRTVWVGGIPCLVPIFERTGLSARAEIAGPALIEQYDAVTYVAPGWLARANAGDLVLER
ncbi:MAG TPA: hydantoinase/oxoprolinase family protein, partial [Candidatus Baltobacteraceae bacterium]